MGSVSEWVFFLVARACVWLRGCSHVGRLLRIRSATPIFSVWGLSQCTWAGVGGGANLSWRSHSYQCIYGTRTATQKCQLIIISTKCNVFLVIFYWSCQWPKQFFPSLHPGRQNRSIKQSEQNFKNWQNHCFIVLCCPITMKEKPKKKPDLFFDGSLQQWLDGGPQSFLDLTVWLLASDWVPTINLRFAVFLCFTDIHTEAVQAALAKHKEEKMALPMPTKRRSTYVPSPIETRTPPGRTKRTAHCNKLEVAGMDLLS